MLDLDSDTDPESKYFNNGRNCDYYTENQFNEKFGSEHNIKIIHFNSRSLYANFYKIKDYLDQFTSPFSVIAISETWISLEKGVEFELDGYNLNYVNRGNKRGGGVALYVDRRLKYKIVESMTAAIDDICECITVEIDMGKRKNIIVSCAYRAPNNSIEKFKEVMESMATNTEQKVTFLCGDYNIDLLNPNKLTPIEKFMDAMYSRSLYPTITKPSRITVHSATLIDNIFTNNLIDNIESGLLLNDISDHLPVFAIYSGAPRLAERNEMIERRLRTVDNLNKFRNELSAQNWRKVYEAEEVDYAYDSFLQTFLMLYDRCCPIQQSRKRANRSDKPWLTKGLLNACKKKNFLYKEFIKNRNKEKEMKYKRYKNKLTDIMRNCKKDYYCKLLDKNKNNIKETWKILNSIIRNQSTSSGLPEEILDNDKIINDKKEMVEGFNKFFVNVGPKLEEQINLPQGGCVAHYLGKRNPDTIFLKDTDKNEIIAIVNNFKKKTSRDWNGIDMTIVKEVIINIADPLAHICNVSLQTGFFPTKMKTAKVIPIFKEGEKNLYNNYRPVSLLSQFSKILEKIFATRMDSFIDKHGLLIDSQYGFRPNRSTSLALMDLVEELTSTIDNKKMAIGVFIDLKKAFDTINHDTLLHKLESYGIRGVGLNWVQSYIGQRKQFVQIGDKKSTLRNITCGVPQGSILGPKLFIIYINDISNASRILKNVIFADDTNVFCEGGNLEQLLEAVSTELTKLKLWFDINRLSLNVKKTKFMVFGKSNTQANTHIELMIDNIKIERVFEYSFLGVMIDHKLSWRPQVTRVQSKLARCVGILVRVRHILNIQSLHTLYCTLFAPYLSYCVEVWGNTYKSTLQAICTIQKKAIRIVNKVGYYEHTNTLFLKLNILKFMDLKDFKMLQIVFKARNSLLSGNIQSWFSDRLGDYNLRGRLKLRQPKVHSTLKSRCISVCGVKLWNNLPDKIKDCKHIAQFKKHLKLYTLAKYEICENIK